MPQRSTISNPPHRRLGSEGGHGAYRSQMPEPPIRCTSWRPATRRRTSCARSRPPGHPPSRPCAPTSSAPDGDGADGAGRRPRAPRCWSPILLRPRARGMSCPCSASPAAIAAVECARGFGADARLSWPNDVVCEHRKLAGVLAELGPGRSVLLGVGMNLAARASRPAPGRPPGAHLPAARDGRRPDRA